MYVYTFIWFIVVQAKEMHSKMLEKDLRMCDPVTQYLVDLCIECFVQINTINLLIEVGCGHNDSDVYI